MYFSDFFAYDPLMLREEIQNIFKIRIQCASVAHLKKEYISVKTFLREQSKNKKTYHQWQATFQEGRLVTES